MILNLFRSVWSRLLRDPEVPVNFEQWKKARSLSWQLYNTHTHSPPWI